MHLELIRLQPHDVSLLWDQFKPGIEESILQSNVYATHDVLNNILAATLGQTLVAWGVGREQDGKREIVGLVLTAVMQDAITGLRSLNIYAISAATTDLAVWEEAFRLLRKTAEAYQCHQIVAVVQKKSLQRILSGPRFGADITSQLAIWRI